MSSLKVKDIEQRLLQTHQKDARQAALLILQKITGLSRTALLIAPEVAMTSAQENELNSLVECVTVQHMPIQYALGTVSFLDLSLEVRPPILIPRPETEEWCARVIAEYAGRSLSILDLCTGSGCIALACAHALPHAQILGVDISPVALELARSNAVRNSITNVKFVYSDLFEACTDTYDVIVANPPYISPEEYATLDKEIRWWEDERALVAAEQGLQVLRRLVAEAPKFLSRAQGLGHLWCEIGHKQAATVMTLFEAAGFAQVTVLQDLSGKERVVWGKL